MKLYSVLNLYVIKVKDTYFICHKSSKDNIYIEFFTREKIVVKNQNDIESLKKYYSLLGVIDFKTKESLRLTKKQILLKYLEINDKVVKKKEQTDYKDENKDPLMIEVWQEYAASTKDKIDIPIVSVKKLKK